MRLSGEPTAPLMVRLPQKPVSPERVKRIGALEFPSARSRPPLATARLIPAARATVTPGSMIKVEPLGIVTFVVITMGLLLAAQIFVKGGGGTSRNRSATWIKSLLPELTWRPIIASVWLPRPSQLLARPKSVVTAGCGLLSPSEYS